MFENILENLGKFWIPNNVNESVTGKINKNNNYYEISFVNVKFNDYDKNYLLLNGLVKDKKLSLVILNNPIRRSHSRVMNNTYIIRNLFEGQHYQDINDINFRNVNIKIDNIGSVIHLHSLSPQNPPLNSNKPEILLMRNPYNEYVANLNEFDLKIFLQSFSTVGWSSNGQYVNFNDEIIIKLNFNEDKNIHQIYDYISKIKDLFTFITGNSNVIGLFESSDDNHPEIKIFLPILRDDYSKKYQQGELFQIDKKNVQTIFENWFENYDYLNGVYDLYFSTIDSNLSSETLFLTYCQIIESYHRKRYEGEYVSEEKFETFKSNFTPCATKIEGLDDIVSKPYKGQFLNKVLNSISYSFEFTLKDRLIELFSEFKECELFMEIVDKYVDEKTDDKKIKSFCDIIKDHRNYYTHYGDEPKNMLCDIDFLILIQSLEHIIELIFLKEMGFSIDEMNNITQNPRFNFVDYYE